MLVVVAEDDPDVTFLLESLLADLGHDVSSTRTGADALAVCRERRPDILLLDRRMPGELDGIGVVREIRADPCLADLPVVLLTARAGADQVEAGLAAGANAYLVKPFAMRELTSLLTSLTSSA